MSFIRAYFDGEPVCVTLPGGAELIVVGFVTVDDGVSWMDDGFLNPPPTRPPTHHLVGPLVADGPDLICAGHRFREIEHGERAAGYWNDLVNFIDPRPMLAVHDEAEYILKIERAAS